MLAEQKLYMRSSIAAWDPQSLHEILKLCMRSSIPSMQAKMTTSPKSNGLFWRQEIKPWTFLLWPGQIYERYMLPKNGEKHQTWLLQWPKRAQPPSYRGSPPYTYHISTFRGKRNIAYRNVLCSVWYICCCLFMFNFVLVLWEADEATIWIDIGTQGCQRPVDKCLPCHKICPSIDPWPCVPLHFFHRLLAKLMKNFDKFWWDHIDFILLGPMKHINWISNIRSEHNQPTNDNTDWDRNR